MSFFSYKIKKIKKIIEAITLSQKNGITQELCNSWVVKKQNEFIYICNKCRCLTPLKNNTSFKCSICEDDSFITKASLFENNNFLYIKSFNMQFLPSHDDRVWKIEGFLKYPFFQDDDLEFKSVKIAKLSITYYGKVEFSIENSSVKSKKIISNDSVYSFDKFVYNLLAKNLVLYIFKNHIKPKDISWLVNNLKFKEQTSSTQIEMLKFFLQRPSVKEIDFFYWRGFDTFYSFYWKNFKSSFAKESDVINVLNFIIGYNSSKALKKALYLSYENAIKNKMYNPYVDYIFALYFKDVNYLRELILIDSKVKNHLFKDSNYIKMLFAIYNNSAKKVKSYFLSVNYEHLKNRTLSDTYNMLKKDNFYTYIIQNGIKLPTNPTKLHDEVVKIYNKVSAALLKNETFIYQKYQADSMVEFGGLTFILPRNKLELLKYAQMLSNCAYSYADKIQRGYSVIYFVLKEKKYLYYAIEIKGQSIIQAKAKYNQEIKKEDRSIVNQWFSNIYLNNLLKEF